MQHVARWFLESVGLATWRSTRSGRRRKSMGFRIRPRRGVRKSVSLGMTRSGWTWISKVQSGPACRHGTGPTWRSSSEAEGDAEALAGRFSISDENFLRS